MFYYVDKDIIISVPGRGLSPSHRTMTLTIGELATSKRLLELLNLVSSMTDGSRGGFDPKSWFINYLCAFTDDPKERQRRIKQLHKSVRIQLFVESDEVREQIEKETKYRFGLESTLTSDKQYNTEL